jgi:leucyl aminopeptidase
MKALTEYLRFDNGLAESPAPDQHICPLMIVSQPDYDSFINSLLPHQKHWLALHVSAPAPGAVFTLPDAHGELGMGVVIVGETAQWDIARAARSLPACIFTANTEFAGTTSVSDIQLGWGLAQYEFAPHKPARTIGARLKLAEGEVDRSVDAQLLGMFLCREMINQPANIMTPQGIEDICMMVADSLSADCIVTKGKKLETYGPAVHVVGRAAEIPPRIIDMRWGDTGPLITLVGKGVCFDSGGLDIKPSKGMEIMKKDMGGAAHVLGLAVALMASDQNIRLRVLIGAAENAISEKAMRPLDVIKTAAGIDVEVGNTDAEGRLILADLLHHAVADQKGTPDFLLDFATLTGAARIALGTDCPALFANHHKMAQAFVTRGFAIDDPLWHMPLFDRYDSQLDSGQAGLSSTGPSGYGGAITAALFLRRFAGHEVNWGHIDVMAWNLSSKPGRPKGGEAMGLRAAYHLIVSGEYKK